MRGDITKQAINYLGPELSARHTFRNLAMHSQKLGKLQLLMVTETETGLETGLNSAEWDGNKSRKVIDRVGNINSS